MSDDQQCPGVLPRHRHICLPISAWLERCNRTVWQPIKYLSWIQKVLPRIRSQKSHSSGSGPKNHTPLDPVPKNIFPWIRSQKSYSPGSGPEIILPWIRSRKSYSPGSGPKNHTPLDLDLKTYSPGSGPKKSSPGSRNHVNHNSLSISKTII